MHKQRLNCILCALLSSAASHAQDCLPDANGDGLPLFSGPFVHVTDRGDPVGLQFADLDADGDLDAVLPGNSGGGDNDDAFVLILINDGDGLLQRTDSLVTAIDLSWETSDVAIADIDQDGDLDLVASNAGADSLSIFFNAGDAQFDAGPTIPVGQEPRSVVVGRLDADETLDIACMNVTSGDVSVLRGFGDGTFAPEQRYPVPGIMTEREHNPNFPYVSPDMDVADVDNDGDLDLAIPTSSSITVLLNDEGAFSPAPDQPDFIGFTVYQVIAVDLDQDGDVDLAASMYGIPSGAAVVLQADDGWSDPVLYPVTYFDAAIVLNTTIHAADADNDGDLDLALGQHSFHRMSILRNAGDGTFEPHEAFDTQEWPRIAALADINNDGWADLHHIGLWPLRPGLATWLGDGEGGFIAPQRVSQLELPEHGGLGMVDVRTADLNLDGAPDLLSFIFRFVRIMGNDGTGVFNFYKEIELPIPSQLSDVAIGDINGDGLPDLVAPDCISCFDGPGRVWVALATGGFEYAFSIEIEFDDTFPVRARLADLDGDADLDLVMMTVDLFQADGAPLPRRIVVALNDGHGAFSVLPSVKFADPPAGYAHVYGLDCADVDGDGDVDVAAATSARNVPGVVGVFLNDGAGNLTLATSWPSYENPVSLAFADLDADLDQDIAVTHETRNDPYLAIYHNGGNADFSLGDVHADPIIGARGTVTPIDLNGDGHLDLVAPEGAGAAIVHIGEGDGTFGPPTMYAGIAETYDVTTGDYDADGRIDLAIGNSHMEAVMVLRNRGCPSCPADLNGDGALSILDFIEFQMRFMDQDLAADCDGDGALTNPLDFICFQQQFLAGCE